MACKMSSKVYHCRVTLWHGSSYTEYIALLDNIYSFMDSLHFLIFSYMSEIFLNFNPHSWKNPYVNNRCEQQWDYKANANKY